MKQVIGKGALIALFFIFAFSFVYSLEECPGETIISEDVPCLILLPYSSDCNGLNVTISDNSSVLYTTSTQNYTASQCSFVFNQSDIGTYPFIYSNGDTGNILVEVSRMIDIFHVMVFAVIGTLGLIFIIMMHIFQEDNTSLVYGGLSCVTWIILAVINISGFNMIRNTVFIVDVNYYITALAVILAIYTATSSYFFYKENYKPKQNPYTLRQ